MRLSKSTLIIISLILFFATFHFLGWPLLNGKIFIPFRSVFSFFNKQMDDSTQTNLSKEELIKQNKELSDKITDLTIEDIKIKLLEEENQKLRKELNFTKKISQQTILVNVIGQKNESGITWFVIDRGIRDGLEEGMVAMSDGAVVGKIIKVANNLSYILPLFSDRTRLAVAVTSPPNAPVKNDEIEGIIEGRNGLAVELKLIPVDKDIKNDDWVITSGLEYDVPRGLFVGVLKDIESKPTDLFFKATVEVPYKLDNLDMVNIVIPQK
jgi:rod shape-determining protein MreC